MACSFSFFPVYEDAAASAHGSQSRAQKAGDRFAISQALFRYSGRDFCRPLVVGNLKPIGMQYHLDNPTLALGIAVFSATNFIDASFGD
jgi:hypothetical protein